MATPSSSSFDIRDSLKKMREWQARAAAGQPTGAPTPPKLGAGHRPGLLLKEDIAGLNNQDFQAEKEAFQQAVPAQVEFKPYVSEPTLIEVRGVLKIGGGAGLQFLMTTKSDDGLYLSCEQLQADEAAINVLAKLRAYYDVWYQQSLEKLNR